MRYVILRSKQQFKVYDNLLKIVTGFYPTIEEAKECVKILESFL